MSFYKVKNRAESTLASGVSNSDLSLTVATGEGANFPSGNFLITIESEILLCSSRSTDVLTIVREQEGTTAAAHASGKAVELRITAGIIQQIQRGGGSINIETLSANKTLTVGTDQMYQYLDEGGASRNITLSTTGAVAGDRFIVRHNGDYSDTHFLQILQDASTLDIIYAGGIKKFIFDGTNWISGEVGSGETDDKRFNVALGYRSDAQNKGTAVGYMSDADNYGVSIGHYSIGRLYGVGVGRSADGANRGVAVGYQANTNDKYYSIALGYYSEAIRTGELSKNISGYNNQKSNIIMAGWDGETANNTPAEIFCGGVASERFTIRASSVLAFRMLITARDNTSGDCVAYKVEGAIKRDGAGNTAMLAVATATVIHEDDATWTVAVTADDANEALIITVTGDATNVVQWVARMDAVETHF